eukprot:COSAG01_NODE_4_length_55812_cov_1344.168109_37_plen_60_part_00
MIQAFLVVCLSLLTGALLGFLFTLCRLPLPAPPTFAGVCGVFGIYAGYRFFLLLSERFF